jgi:uncharacterized protein YbcI
VSDTSHRLPGRLAARSKTVASQGVIWYSVVGILGDGLPLQGVRSVDVGLQPSRVLMSGLGSKTQGELEAAICEGISRFEQEYMGRGPKDVHTHLIGDLLVVRLQGVLTAAEQHLVKSLPAEKGRDLLKQVRTHLVETARPVMEAMVQEVTGVKVLTMHHDISTVTGEEVVLFTLAESPGFRDAKKK